MAAKIKDGLFIGDAETSQSEIFINDNKISNLINVAGRDVPNVWAAHGLVYLTYNWEDRPEYRLFSGHDDSILTDIVEFIDVSISHGISVLIFSKRGTGRCIIASCLYLMMKYRWGFEKSYDYVFSKKPDVDLNKGFIQQMFALDMKLLASRQKAYALKHGIENGFRIEPNMTINDIASMLPVNEAKRWNSWDPTYILHPQQVNGTIQGGNDAANKLIDSEENIHWQKYSESVIGTVKKKDYNVMKALFLKQKVNLRALDDMEEELVLIFSFVNSKNTITSLPGPYHNIYEVHKNFKLRFDTIVFEEDVNWFPAAYKQNYVPKGILKGGMQRQNAHHSQTEKLLKLKEDKDIATSNVPNLMRTSIDKSVPPPAAYTGMNNRTPSDSTSSTSNSVSEDLYKFVGMNAQPKDANRHGGNKEEKKNHTLDTNSNASTRHDADLKQSSTHSSASYANTALSAEERLRKLMADMQKQSFFPDHIKSSTPSTTTTTTKSAINDNPMYISTASSTTAPSLYDLANMHVQPSTASTASHAPPRHERREEENIQKELFADDLDIQDQEGYGMDPLAAFDVSVVGQKGGSKGGAMRARHDILSNTAPVRSSLNGSQGSRTTTTTAAPPARQAWTSTPTRGSSSPVVNRYSSPSTRPSSNASSNMSVTSVGSNVSNTSNPNAYVGAGSTSSARVYRHGSPAPNTRPTPSANKSSTVPRPTGGSNISVVSTSMSSLGSMGSAANQNNPPARYSSPQVQRYASPTPSNPALNSSQRRSSFSSNNSTGSNASMTNNVSSSPMVDKRKAYGASPMRASYSGGGTTTTNTGYGSRPASPSPQDAYLGGSRRFTTPTPQSGQHSDYDNANRRPSTPTRQGWKF